jgi:DNA modification methylase
MYAEKYNAYLGDCMQAMAGLPDNSVDLVVTDPPYVVSTTGAGMYKRPDKRYVQDLAPMSNGFTEQTLDEMCRVLKKINIYIFCSQKQIMPLLDYFVTRKRCNWNLITWHKSNPVPACGNKYLTDTEYILFFREKGVRVYGEFDTKRTYYVTPLNQADKKKYGHPTVKPVGIVQNLIINSSRPGDVVLDPYMGSGTTGAACMNTGRHFIGMEKDPHYFQIAKERIERAIETMPAL